MNSSYAQPKSFRLIAGFGYIIDFINGVRKGRDLPALSDGEMNARIGIDGRTTTWRVIMEQDKDTTITNTDDPNSDNIYPILLAP